MRGGGIESSWSEPGLGSFPIAFFILLKPGLSFQPARVFRTDELEQLLKSEEKLGDSSIQNWMAMPYELDSNQLTYFNFSRS